jgi:hypothetical protein
MLVEWLVESPEQVEVHSTAYVGAKRRLGVAGLAELDILKSVVDQIDDCHSMSENWIEKLVSRHNVPIDIGGSQETHKEPFDDVRLDQAGCTAGSDFQNTVELVRRIAGILELEPLVVAWLSPVHSDRQ